jgi:hypothetical protein
MPRLKPQEVAAALPKPSRSPAQLANDARLRVGKPKAAVSTDDFSGARADVSISGAGKAEVERSQIEVVPSMIAAEDEAFMNEYVVIQLEQDDDPHAPLFVHSGHNGIDQYIQRGVQQKIRLKFLYSLLAAKRTQYACTFGKDNSGNEYNKLGGRTNTTHRVSVIEATPRMRDAIVKWMSLPA